MDLRELVTMGLRRSWLDWPEPRATTPDYERRKRELSRHLIAQSCEGPSEGWSLVPVGGTKHSANLRRFTRPQS